MKTLVVESVWPVFPRMSSFYPVICVFEQWFAAALSGFTTVPFFFFFLSASFLNGGMCVAAVSSHDSQRPRWGTLSIQQTRLSPKIAVGGGGATPPSVMVSRPKAGPCLALQTSRKQAANGTLIDLPFCPPPPNILHLLGSTVAFPAAPWQQRPLSMGAGRETTFSWCHRAVVNGDQAWSAVPASNL